MKSPVQSHRILVTTLSPVHMGTDEDYEPTGYVIEGDVLYELAVDAIGQLPANERNKLNSILSQKAGQDMLTQLQAFFLGNTENLIPASVHQIRIRDGISRLYTSRVGRAANIESDGKKVQNKLEIERCAFNPGDRLPILPGSGIKGAIRTALLDRINGGSRLRDRNEKNRDLQGRLLKYARESRGFDLHRDPMRLVSVADLRWRGTDDMVTTEVCFALNHKKKPVTDRDGRLVQSGSPPVMFECVPAFRHQAFEGSITIQNTSAVASSDKLPAADLMFGFDEIADACNAFYRPVWESEKQILRQRGYQDKTWLEAADSLIDKKLAGGTAFLLRVGRHSGVESVTLNGVRNGNVKIMQGKGKNPRYEDTATTLWLAADEPGVRDNMQSFGWILIETDVADQALTVPQSEKDWTASVRQRISELHNRQSKQLEAERQKQQEAEQKLAAERAFEQAREAKLQQALDGLPGDAATLVKWREDEAWMSDNQAKITSIEAYLDEHEVLSGQALELLIAIVDQTWKGILNDPHATQGKKQKPKYKPGPIKLAERVLALKN